MEVDSGMRVSSLNGDGGRRRQTQVITTRVEAKEMNEPSMASIFGVKSKRQSPILGAEAKKLPHTEVAEAGDVSAASHAAAPNKLWRPLFTSRSSPSHIPFQ